MKIHDDNLENEFETDKIFLIVDGIEFEITERRGELTIHRTNYGAGRRHIEITPISQTQIIIT